jgi:hypothetical protein
MYLYLGNNLISNTWLEKHCTHRNLRTKSGMQEDQISQKLTVLEPDDMAGLTRLISTK